uniref:protein spinster-like n=1 Tax=Styela clava TaxID=7725 RepID=UPI00193A7CA6|nr:protein spinster-like [Styela clava]
MPHKFHGEFFYTWYCSLALMLCYAVGELGHFLLGVTSKPMAQDIHFGDQGCMPNEETHNEVHEMCKSSSDDNFPEEQCSNVTLNGSFVCRWDYKGDGVEYQLLAGPFFVAIFTIMGIILGVLGDSYNRVRILFICVLVCSLMTLVTGFSTQYWQLAVLRIGFGAAEAGFSPLSASIIADIFGKTSRGLGMSVFNWGIYFGFGCAFAVGNIVTEANINDQGWRWAYYIAGIPGFFLAFLILLTLKEPTRKNITVTDEKQELQKEEIKGSLKKKPNKVFLLFSKVTTAIKLYATKPSLMVLLIAACIRHSASYCFAYNAQLYFSEYYPTTKLGLWMTISSIVGGSIGIASGGLISDLIVVKHGVHTRMWVLAISQALASPLAFGVLYLTPPFCFFSLIAAYLFAEMWFGIIFAVLVELLPTEVRSTCLATFFFVINNIAGLVLLGVPKLKDNMGSRQALTLVYPGFYLISSFFFALAQILLRREVRSKSLHQSDSNKVDSHDL